MITIFTPSFADEADTNAQNLTVKEIVTRLDPARFEVTMLNEGDVDPRIAARPNTRVLQWKAHGNTVRTLWHCLRDVPDIYFYPREGPLDAAYLQLRRWLHLKTKIVTHIVSGGLDNGPVRPTLERNVRASSLVFGNNEFLSALLCERLGIEARTIHNGVDRRFFYPLSANERITRGDRLAVLFAGSLRPYKRAEIVVRQAARWPNVEFLIAGRGEEEASCRELAQKLLVRNVAFLGHLSLSQLGSEMRRADVFLYPSILDGHPQVLGQAAASGLPVVAMNAYHPDYVIHQKTGFLAQNDSELESLLDLLLTNTDLRASMGTAAIEHASKFDWDEIVESWQAAFEQVVGGKQ